MPQPTVSTGYISEGITSVIWGTDGTLLSPAPGGGYAGTGYYIVDSIDESQKVDIDYGENGTGVEARRTIITHGRRWNITVQDDTNMTPPVVGGTVTVLDLLLSPNAGALGFGAGVTNTASGQKTTAFVATIISNDYRAARKQAGQRILQVENLTLVDNQNTVGA